MQQLTNTVFTLRSFFFWLTEGDMPNRDGARVYTITAKPCQCPGDWNEDVVMGTRLRIDHVRGLNGEETTSVYLAFR